MNGHKSKTPAGRLAILIAAAVIGLGLVVWLIGGRAATKERQVRVDASATAAAATTSPARKPTTRPKQDDFFGAIWNREAKKFDAMLRDDPQLARAEAADDFMTALHAAAWRGDIPAARALLDAGARLEARESSHKGTPLTWAVVSGQLEMVKLLLSRGAKVDDDILAEAVNGIKGRTGRASKATYEQISKLLLAETGKKKN